MSLTLYVALITLAPIVLGLLIYLAGKAHVATTRIVLILAIIGALFPVVLLPLLAPAVAYGLPITIRPFGVGSGFGLWVTPTYRIDAFALYAAMGLAYLISPLLLWMAFMERANDRSKGDASAPEAPESTETPADAGDAVDEPDASGTGVPVGTPSSGLRRALGFERGMATPELVRTAALVLVLETLALSAVLADGLVFLGVAWILAAAAAWAVGETASDSSTIDRPGVLLMCVGPLLWLIIMIFPARAAGAMRLLDLTGRTPINTFEVILLALALALAGGAYPFMVWVRRRAAFATPAGLGALVLVVAPAALYVGARTYTIAVTGAEHWPLFTAAPAQPTTPPPINAGIAFLVLGTATVVASGLLALARRDARSLVALLACAQVGWGLVGLGTGVALSVYGVVVLLATTILGLGAMLAALSAGAVITSDIEPAAEGPRALGDTARPLVLAAWCVGAGTVVGVPILPGFIVRHVVTAGVLQVQGLAVPLLGLCWVGDALLALALLRSVAPALVSQVSAADVAARVREFVVGARDIPATILAVLALIAGIAPALLLGVFSGVAAAPVLGQDTVGDLVHTNVLGYGTSGGQWAVGIAWIAIALVAVVMAIMRPTATRGTAPVYAAGHHVGAIEGAGAADGVADGAVDGVAEDEEPATPLSDPAAAWTDLRPAFNSAWALPGGSWLLAGADEDDGDHDEHGEHEPDGPPEDAAAVGAPGATSAEEAADDER